VENYFHYFSEIEERFQRRRGTLLLLSTLDWALIETWKEAGVPLAAVLRGIDDAFDGFERRPSKSRKVNSLAYCTQSVMSALEEMSEAAIGAAPAEKKETAPEPARIAEYLQANAAQLERASAPASAEISRAFAAAAQSLRETAAAISVPSAPRPALEDLERRLTMLEEKLLAALVAACSDVEMLALRAEADREIAPYRSKMSAAQIAQLQKQFVHKRLLEQHKLPRLSLFYMP